MINKGSSPKLLLRRKTRYQANNDITQLVYSAQRWAGSKTKKIWKPKFERRCWKNSKPIQTKWVAKIFFFCKDNCSIVTLHRPPWPQCHNEPWLISNTSNILSTNSFGEAAILSAPDTDSKNWQIEMGVADREKLLSLPSKENTASSGSSFGYATFQTPFSA